MLKYRSILTLTHDPDILTPSTDSWDGVFPNSSEGIILQAIEGLRREHNEDIQVLRQERKEEMQDFYERCTRAFEKLERCSPDADEQLSNKIDRFLTSEELNLRFQSALETEIDVSNALDVLSARIEDMISNERGSERLNLASKIIQERLDSIQESLHLDLQDLNTRNLTHFEKLYDQAQTTSNDLQTLSLSQKQANKIATTAVFKVSSSLVLGSSSTTQLPPAIVLPVNWNEHYLNKFISHGYPPCNVYVAFPDKDPNAIEFDAELGNFILQEVNSRLKIFCIRTRWRLEEKWERVVFPPRAKELALAARENSLHDVERYPFIDPPTVLLIQRPDITNLRANNEKRWLFTKLADFLGKRGYRLGWTELYR